MGSLASIINFFIGEKCEKLIRYDQRVIEIKGMSPKIGDIEFPLAEFSTHIEKVREASEVATALDDYQFLMCRFCKGLGKDDPRWRKYTDLRASTILILTDLRVKLAILKNSKSNDLGLESTINKMKSLQDIDIKVIPNVNELRQKDIIEKQDIPDVKPQAVLDTKELAEINEEHLEALVRKLKDYDIIRGSGLTKSEEDTILSIRALISECKEHYQEAEMKDMDLDEIYRLVSPCIRQFYMNVKYKNIIESRFSAALNGHMAALFNQIRLYKQAKDRNQESKIKDYGTDAKVNFDETIVLLDSIDISLPLVTV